MDLHGILVVDKPRGLTSHDVVARVRRLLRTRKIGHAGTLDPAAEGLLVLGVGRATKLLGSLMSHPKRYAAHIVLGAGSESGDIEGSLVLPESSYQTSSKDDIRAALERFIGEIEQQPPAYAAIKIGGQPLYRSARRGEPIDVPSRRVTVSSLELLDYREPNLFLNINCSAGTYIRSLARDIGASLGTSAYLHALLRVESGGLSLREAWTMEDLEEGLQSETFERFALHPLSADDQTAALTLGPNSVNAWYDGRPVAATGRFEFERAHAFRTDGTWLGFGVRDRDDWQPKVVLRG